VNATALLAGLRLRGVELRADGDLLRYRAPKGTLSTEEIADLARHKAEILAMLGGRPPAPPAPSLGAGVGTAHPVLHFGAEGWNVRYHLVNTPEKFRDFLLRLRQQRRFAIDLETTSLDPTQAQIVGYSFCWEPGEGWYLPVLAPPGESCLSPARTLERLRPVLEDTGIAKINQNIKYDLEVLRRHGVRLAGVAGDSMLADYLLRAGERGHDEDGLALRYLNYRMIPITDLIGPRRGKAPQRTMDQVPSAEVAVYAAEDADVAYRLCDLLEEKLKEHGLGELYKQVEVPLVEVLADMEHSGIRLDVPLLARLGHQMGREITKLQREIYHLAGHRLNLNSPDQIRELLFDKLKLPVQGTTEKGKAQTDADTLETLAALGHELPAKLLEYRGLVKLKGTYVDAMPKLVSPVTGRLHTSFNQAVTATGRLSASNPNLQTIPSRTERGQKIRQAFLPESGWLLLKADYSQIELRVLAHFCGDAELRRAYQEDRDIHALVASQVFRVPEGQVTAEQRRFAKTVNFGVIYGMSAFGLARRLGIPEPEAATFIDAYFARYPEVARYQDRLLAECRRRDYVDTLLGRRRYVQGVRPFSTYHGRSRPERAAINMQIQGSAADLIKLAMVNIYRRLRREGRRARLLLQVHDELVFEVPPDEFQALAGLVTEEMEGAMTLAVPLKVDLAAGPNWLDVRKR
jgi:DNA polymerase-1